MTGMYSQGIGFAPVPSCVLRLCYSGRERWDHKESEISTCQASSKLNGRQAPSPPQGAAGTNVVAHPFRRIVTLRPRDAKRRSDLMREGIKPHVRYAVSLPARRSQSDPSACPSRSRPFGHSQSRRAPGRSRRQSRRGSKPGRAHRHPRLRPPGDSGHAHRGVIRRGGIFSPIGDASP